MTLCLTQVGNLRYAIKYNVIWANHKSKSFVYRWLRTLAMFDVTRFSAFVVINQLIKLLYIKTWTLAKYKYYIYISGEQRVRRAPGINYGQSQIAFHAYLTDHARGLGIHQVVPFDGVRLNAGDAFDPVMHTFICPLDGVYVFQSALLAEHQDMVQTAIVLDGTKGAIMYAAGAGTGHGYDQGFNSLVTLCKRGQHVWVHNEHRDGPTVFPANYTTFSGFLLWEVESTPIVVA